MNSIKASFPWKPRLGLYSYNHNLTQKNPSLWNLVCGTLLFECLIHSLQHHVPKDKCVKLTRYDKLTPAGVCGKREKCVVSKSDFIWNFKNTTVPIVEYLYVLWFKRIFWARFKSWTSEKKLTNYTLSKLKFSMW